MGFLQQRQVGASLCCSVQASHGSGFSCCGAWALGRGLQQLWLADSVVVAHRLSCSMACGILLDQGLNQCPLHWQAESQPWDYQEVSNTRYFSYHDILHCWGMKNLRQTPWRASWQQLLPILKCIFPVIYFSNYSLRYAYLDI